MAAVPGIMATDKLQSSQRDKDELKDPVQEPSATKKTNKFKRDRVNENSPKAKRSKSSAPETKGSSKDQTSLRTFFKSQTTTPPNTVRLKGETEHIF